MPSPLATRQLLIGGLLPGLSPDLLTWATPRLTRRMREITLAPGATLFTAGDPAPSYYLLVAGSLALGPQTRTAPDETVGWLDAILERPRTATAQAITAVTAHEIPIADFTAVVEDSLDLSLGLIEERARRALAARPVSLAAQPLPADLTVTEPDPFTRRLELLRRCGCMRYARIQTLASLAESAEQVVVDGPFTAGNDTLWLVARGSVVAEERTYGPGSTVLGPGAFLDRAQPRPALARAAELVRLELDDWFDVAEESFDLVRSTLVWIEEERRA